MPTTQQLPTKAELAEAFNKSHLVGCEKYPPICAADITEITAVGLCEDGIDFHVEAGCTGEWFAVTLNSEGQPDPETIEALPF